MSARGLYRLPVEIGQLTSLQTLDIHECPGLVSLPDEILRLGADVVHIL